MISCAFTDTRECGGTLEVPMVLTSSEKGAGINELRSVISQSVDSFEALLGE